MRKKIGKRIGPVPIALVAVLALAALLSAGLLVFNSGGAQAQTATGIIDDVTLDVDQARDQTADDVAPTTDDHILTLSTVNIEDNDAVNDASRAFPVGSTTFTIESDQDDTGDNDLTGDDDKNGGIETASSGGDPASPITISNTGVIEIPAGTAQESQAKAEQADNTARITVTARSEDSETLTVRFNLTIVQDPLKVAGIPATDQSTSGACEVVSDGTGLTSRGNPIPDFTANATGIKISGGACSTAAESVAVTFKHSDDDNAAGDDADATVATHLVYVTGGSGFTNVRPRIAKSGLDEHVVQLKDSDAIAYEPQTIDVTKSMADDDGMVYLIGYGNQPNNANKLTTASTTFEDNADFAVVVEFVDGPARAFDADRDDKTFNPATPGSDDDVDGSTLTVSTSIKPMGMGDEDKDGYDDGTYFIPDSDAAEIMVMATIRDAKGRDVSGGDKDSRVDFSVMYAEGSDITDNAKDYESRVEVKKGKNTAGVGVSGWKANENAVKVTVSATFTGPTAPDGLDLGTVTLVRVAEIASSADFATYSCATKTDATASKGCAARYAASADMRFGREEHFVVYGQFNDSLGSKVDRNPQLKLSDAAKDALESAGSAMGYSASASDGALLVMVKEEAAFGDYTIMVTNGRSGDAELTQELTIYVAGPPAEYMVDPMETHIPLRSRATFTVTAMDEMDGVPAFTTTGDERNDMVQIDAPYGNVRGTMVDSDDVLTLDADTGMGTFSYTMLRDAEQGEMFSIFIGEGDMQVEIIATAGMEPTEPGMPMNVMAEATSHDMIAVSWESPADDGGSDITGYVLQSKTGTMDFMTIAASSAEVWWNTLDCPMMNAEIPDDATPAPPMDDTDMTSPYCAMYAGLSAEATTVVDDVFADKYDTISGTSHSDMGLMAETTYYYRVSAINSVGKGEYSNGMAMAMTMAENMAPMAGDDVEDQMVYVGAMVEVQSNFSDPDEDTLSYMASSDMMDVATATVDSAGMVTITGVAEGMATITVTASDPMDAYAMQTIMVNVMMALPMELGDTSIISAMSNAAGEATIMIMPGDNATKHYIWVQPTDRSQGMYSDEAAGDADMVTISGLTSGMNYWFTAIAGRGTGTDSEWSAWSGWTEEKSIQ